MRGQTALPKKPWPGHGAPMRIALFEPEIAGNVGTILRTAACFGAGVDLIEPMGFPWSDRALARAGMDYRAHVDIRRHVDWDAFLSGMDRSDMGTPRAGRIVLFTTRGATPLPRARFLPGDTLLFGRESAGVPDAVHAAADARVRIPMAAGMRSLNLAVSAGIALAEAIRQTGLWPQDAEAEE